MRQHLKFKFPDKLNPALVMGMFQYEDFLWKSYPRAEVIVNCDFEVEGHSATGEHPKGGACDFHVVGISLVDAWLAAERIPVFRGIGVYTDWSFPGLHCDVRDDDVRARWWRRANVYVAADRLMLAAIGGVNA